LRGNGLLARARQVGKERDWGGHLDTGLPLRLAPGGEITTSIVQSSAEQHIRCQAQFTSRYSGTFASFQIGEPDRLLNVTLEAQSVERRNGGTGCKGEMPLRYFRRVIDGNWLTIRLRSTRVSVFPVRVRTDGGSRGQQYSVDPLLLCFTKP
jgi:hypothetical protein